MSGLLIGLRGILGSAFSRGLDTVGERAEKELDWSYRGASWLAGTGEGTRARTWAGPVAVICHSAGEEGSYKFAEAFGRKIDLAFFVDSWFPDQKPHPHYRRVYSIKAGKGGRFHVQGANVVAQILYPDETHTSIDDEPKLHDFVIAKLAELTGETHTQEPPMSEYQPYMRPDITLPDNPYLTALVDAWRGAMDPAKESRARQEFNRVFSENVRNLFTEGYTQKAYDGCRTMIWAFDTYFRPRGETDHHLAWWLAIARNETGDMQPVKETERGGKIYSDEKVISILDAWWNSGEAQSKGVRSRYWKDGAFGRGLPQLTWPDNYTKGAAAFERFMGFPVPFGQREHYDLVMVPPVSAIMAFIGSVEGMFTGKKFADYRNADGSYDFAGARAIVNGDRHIVTRDLDRDGKREKMGDEIAGMANIFLKAIQSARKAADAFQSPQVPDTVEPPDTLPEPSLPDMSTIRDELLQIFPHLTEKDIETELLRLYLTRWRPSSEIAEPSPAIERGFSLPEPQKGTEMDGFKKWWESKGVNGGIVAVLSLLLMLTGNDVPVEEVANLGDKLVELVGIISALVSIWGRLRADTKIG